MPAHLVTVFGGTGFLGRRIVRHLYDVGFAVRIASRHPDRAAMIFPDVGPRLRSIRGDINDEGSIAAAVADAFAVVNAASLYVERGRDTFQSVHVNAAERVARFAREAGAQDLCMFPGSAPTPGQRRPTSAAEDRAKQPY
jgi:uncharacterized protein YbjT (DUF2867 family)